MREIKFRAWDKHRMRSWDDITGCSGFHHWLFGQQQDIILMQYTGLKDKNGVEIYEGDIVRVGGGDVTTCKWSVYQAGFNLIGLTTYAVGFTHYGENKQEVIGNIYENKELLDE